MIVEKSMMLITGVYQGYPTFKAIALTLDCPYIQMVYSPATRGLGIMTKDKAHVPNFVTKMTEDGQPVESKKQKGIVAQERRMMDVYNEYEIIDVDEMEKVINMFCINATGNSYTTEKEVFNWKKYLVPVSVKSEFSSKIEE